MKKSFDICSTELEKTKKMKFNLCNMSKKAIQVKTCRGGV
ncbi:hypothetical protein FEM08_29530 [Flavobacterium gilvum]|nr:hypothetical protein FEM08_29530 [Flavobacterium gilvum]